MSLFRQNYNPHPTFIGRYRKTVVATDLLLGNYSYHHRCNIIWMLQGNWKGSSWSHFAFRMVWPIDKLYVHVYSFLLTSTLAVSIIDTGQSAYTYKLNYAHHEAAASIVIVFLMAKCERIVHKSFWVICPVQRQHGTIPRCWLLIAQAHGPACLVSDYEAFSDFYFIELFKLSCDHMSLFRLNHVVCRSILLCFFYWIPQDLLKYIKYLH